MQALDSVLPEALGFDYEVAKYTSKGEEYDSSPFAQALPDFPDTREELQDLLQVIPTFSASLLAKPFLYRRLRLRRLATLFIPTPRVCELAEHIYAILLQSYATRGPGSAMSRTITHRLSTNENIQDDGSTVQLCSALTGIPGAGKSVAIKQCLRMYPSIIFHKALNIWQIPALFVQMPYHGKNGVSLAVAIIGAIHERYPLPNYPDLYLRRGLTEDKLKKAAKDLLWVHRVGLLIVDDAQKAGVEPIENYNGEVLAPAPKKKTPMGWVAGLLFEAVNEIRVPLLLVATAEFESAMSATLSMIRRTSGNGLQHWTPMSAEIVKRWPSEFDIYLNFLWSLTLLRKHPKLDVTFRSIFLLYSYGIPDLALKLYYVVMWRTLQDGEETFDHDDVHRIAQKYLHRLVRVAVKMRDAAQKDAQAQRDLFHLPDVAAELNLRSGVAGVVERPPLDFIKLKRRAKKLEEAVTGPVQEPAKAPAPLPQAVTAHHSELGDDE